MRVKGLLISAVMIVFALSFAGCGGGGGGAAPAGVSGFSKGVITAKGSVTVNGVKFDTSKSGIVKFDNISGLNDDKLKVGMVVKIKGKIDDASKTGTADKIEFTDNLEGPVTSKDPVAKTLVIFGQTVKVDNTTVFEGFTGFDDPLLAAGVRVEVSGFPDSTGKILATRIENKTGATDDFEIKGTVSGFTAGGTTFTLTPPNSTGLSITLGAGVTLPAGFGNGKFVEVRTTGSGAAITASKVELEDELKADDNDRVEVEGLVTSVDTTLKTFVVNGVTVDASAMTMPTVGQKVEVEGTFVNGKLVPAKQMEVEKESNVKLEGNVAAAADVDLFNKTIKLNGVTVTTSSTTLFRDSDSSGGKTPVVNFSLANIAVGNHLEIAGFLDAGGRVVATRVERMMQGTRTVVQGPVSTTATPDLIILGITVKTGATTQFKKSDGTSFANQAAFFAAVNPGITVVKARGTLTAPSTLDTNVTDGEAEIEL